MPARSVKKVSKKSPNTDFVVFFDSFSGHLGLFRHFDTPGREAREVLFETFFGDFGARGCGHSCIWGLQSQLMCVIRVFTESAYEGARITQKILPENPV